MFILLFLQFLEVLITQEFTDPYSQSHRMHDIGHCCNTLHMSHPNTEYSYQKSYNLADTKHLDLNDKNDIHDHAHIASVQSVYHIRNEQGCHQSNKQEHNIQEDQNVLPNHLKHFPHYYTSNCKIFH